MATPTREQVIERLRTVKDPELHRDIVSLNMVKDVAIEDGRVRVHVELTTPACPLKEQIGGDVTRAVKAIAGVRQVALEWSANVRSSRGPAAVLPDVKNVIAVGAGKGGVGKSTIAALLAVGLQRDGAAVGLMDADVYGPSIPTMFGVAERKPAVRGERILPIDAGGISLMSMGFMVDPDRAVIWRGPMVHGVIRQFLDQVEWGPLDYLIVDLPPGTGDVPLTLAQSLPPTGAIVVCTPQDVALLDARRAVKMFQQLNVRCLGMIENMSYYLCPNCNHRDELFDHGGVEQAAAALDVPFLGEIPLNADIRRFTDDGRAAATFAETRDYVRDAILTMVRSVAGQISIVSAEAEAAPTLTIE
ncbi:MAG: iron-sulfur cluster carrier protein ApbC [Phycisphaerales bacterium]|nr:MAG: iron-sulfur cluster carrier protein ApbC [Phycisphaerales bacterium]